jgi:hypothetical protein
LYLDRMTVAWWAQNPKSLGLKFGSDVNRVSMQ